MYEIFSYLLQKHGVTPYKISKATGVSQSTLSDWKRGISSPKQDKLQKIADYFNVSLEYLTTGKESEEKQAFLSDHEKRYMAYAKELISMGIELNDLKAFIDIIKKMNTKNTKQ